MNVQKITVNNQENSIEHPIKTVDSSQVDLSFSDEDGYVICDISDGHIKTKNFNSRTASVSCNDDSNAVFNIGDSNGYVIALFKDGHIKTKNFDSENIPSPTPPTLNERYNKELIYDIDFSKPYSSYSNMLKQNNNWSFENSKASCSTASTLFTSKIYSLNEKETVVDFSLTTANAMLALVWNMTTGYGGCGSYFSVTTSKLSIHESGSSQTSIRKSNNINLELNRRYIIKALKLLHTNVLILYDGVSGDLISELTVEQTSRNYPSEAKDEFAGGRLMDCFGILPQTGSIEVYRIIMRTLIAKPLIIVYGDSITEGDRCFETETYGYMMKEEFGHNRVSLSGQSGTMISSVIERINNEISIMTDKPKYVMVNIGTNGGNTQELFNTLKTTIESYGCIPIITVPPIMNSINTVREYILNLNTLTVRFDIATAIDNDLSKGKNYSLFYDGTHPNEAGNRAMFNRMKVDIKEIFNY